MFLNIILLLVGVVFLIYGIRNKLKFWIAIGAVVLCMGVVSVCVDRMLPGAENNVNQRLPVVITNTMK